VPVPFCVVRYRCEFATLYVVDTGLFNCIRLC